MGDPANDRKSWRRDLVPAIVGAMVGAIFGAIFGIGSALVVPPLQDLVEPHVTFEVQDTLAGSCFQFESLAIGFRRSNDSASPLLYANSLLTENATERTVDTIEVSFGGRPGPYYVSIVGHGILNNGSPGDAKTDQKIYVSGETGLRYLINSHVESSNCSFSGPLDKEHHRTYRPTLQDARQVLTG